MLVYRKTTIDEDENWGTKCFMLKENKLQCNRRVTRVANLQYMCEGHFMSLLQSAVADKEEVINLDEQREEVTSESEPTEKPKTEA